ncbi:MAG: hypothetical protein HZA46_20290 [Planctomycetales bacterium]|nr:hypothetical protein [Planctomycetales bacterium]
MIEAGGQITLGKCVNAMKLVYFADVEIRPLEGSEHYGMCVSAFVYCFIPARDAHDAEELLAERLKQDHYEVVSLESLRPFDEVEFEKPEDQGEVEELAQSASKQGSFVYGTFYCYENE